MYAIRSYYVLNVGQGSYLEHARNYLIANVYSVEHKGEFDKGGLKWNWGVKAQREEIEDDLSEWKFVDSAGYSVPVITSYSIHYTKLYEIEIHLGPSEPFDFARSCAGQ